MKTLEDFREAIYNELIAAEDDYDAVKICQQFMYEYAAQFRSQPTEPVKTLDQLMKDWGDSFCGRTQERYVYDYFVGRPQPSEQEQHFKELWEQGVLIINNLEEQIAKQDEELEIEAQEIERLKDNNRLAEGDWHAAQQEIKRLRSIVDKLEAQLKEYEDDKKAKFDYRQRKRQENKGLYSAAEKAVKDERFSITVDELKERRKALESSPERPKKIPTIDEAGAIAVRISEDANLGLSAKEQAFFIAGFQECIKYINSPEQPETK